MTARNAACGGDPTNSDCTFRTASLDQANFGLELQVFNADRIAYRSLIGMYDTKHSLGR